MRMRNLIALALLLSLPVYAVRVEQPIVEITGSPYNVSATVRGLSNFVSSASGQLVSSIAKPFPIVSGQLVISNLMAGYYEFSVGNKSIKILSTNDSPLITNSIIQMANLVTNSGVAYASISAPFVSRIIAGTNVSITPTNGIGAVTINSTGSGGLASIPSAFTNNAIRTDSLTVVSNATFSTLNVGTLNATTLPSQIVTNGASGVTLNGLASTDSIVVTNNGSVVVYGGSAIVASINAAGDVDVAGGITCDGGFIGDGSRISNLTATNIIGRISTNSLPTVIPASSVTGVLPAGTVAVNDMTNGPVLGNTGAGGVRMWTNTVNGLSGLTYSVRTLTYSGTNVLLDCSSGNAFKLLLTNNAFITPTNLVAGAHKFMTLLTRQSTNGTYTVLWQTNQAVPYAKFSGGIAPSATTNANAEDVWSMMPDYTGVNLDVVLTPNVR